MRGPFAVMHFLLAAGNLVLYLEWGYSISLFAAAFGFTLFFLKVIDC